MNLAYEPGVHALLGPNGAGKTTLMRAIVGLIPYKGAIHAPDCGYVPQKHDVRWDYPITVTEFIHTGFQKSLFSRKPKNYKNLVEQALVRVRMSEYAHRPVGQLSGGQRQRVLVAKALVLDPPLLLLDEPYTGVDMPTADFLDGVFAAEARRGRTILMSTHDIPGALMRADSITLLRGGVVRHGPATDFAEPDPWVAAFGLEADSVLISNYIKTIHNLKNDNDIAKAVTDA
ncbi:MAG: ATP-binding cassette domain-containing protein [Corynebacterium sp.]|nr:ATP-binding cassette domain-containing protein [Corynebacterium sp.]